ncbi:MAG: glycosyltransferase family 2 protein [Bacteroidota bacterium]
MNLAVVILNWNGRDLLKEFLPAVIINSTDCANIYVIDNGSTDDSIDVLKNEFPSVKIIELKENYGFAQGYNLGLQSVDEEYYVILNSDVMVEKNWLKGIDSYFEQHPQVAALQPTLLDYREKDFFEYAGASGGFIDRNGFVFCDGRIFNHIEKTADRKAKEIFWASGAALIIRKEVFKEVRGFDPDFFAHMEEIDLCWRIKNKGYQIWYYPSSKVFHLGGGTLGKLKPKKTYLNFRNNLFLLTKNYFQGSLLLKIFWRMVLDGIAAWKFLFQGNPLHFLAVGRAHFHFYLNLPKFLKKRAQLKKETSKPNLIGLYQGNIVFDYFLRGKKYFKDLDQSRFRT